MSIQGLIKKQTTQMRAAAALMAFGFPLVGNQETARPGILEFFILVSPEREDEADKLIAECQNLLSPDNNEPGPSVPLGLYERALQRLRKLISAYKEETYNEPRRDSRQRGARTT